jgi:hypothetical protein
MNLTTCPHCRTQVVITSQGECPSCRREVTADGMSTEEPQLITPVEPKAGQFDMRAFLRRMRLPIPLGLIGVIVVLVDLLYISFRLCIGNGLNSNVSASLESLPMGCLEWAITGVVLIAVDYTNRLTTARDDDASD